MAEKSSISKVAALEIDRFLQAILRNGYRSDVGKLKRREFLGRARNRIYRVGIELEGGWTKLPEGVNLEHDGSVQIPVPREIIAAQEEEQVGLRDLQRRAQLAMNDPFGRRNGAPVAPVAKKAPRIVTGEIPSEIMELSKVDPWMMKYYPQYVNGTCGLHIHMSFNSAKDYSRLMAPEYPKTIVDYMIKWAEEEKLPKSHPIWARLNGGNKYCQHEFYADLQAAKTQKGHNLEGEGHRYTVINYCFGLHKSLECRLLPMLDTAEQGVRAVKRVIDITNACLVALARKEEKMKASVIINEDDHVKETRREYLSRVHVEERR